MKVAKKARSAQRAAFTKCYNSFVEKCDNAEQTATDRQIALELLESRMSELEIANGRYVDLLLESEEATEDDLQAEIESHEEYRVKLLTARAKLLSSAPQHTRNEPRNVADATMPRSEKPFKRPTLEIPKFSGHVSEWLQFWSHFRKIHEDHGLSNEEKFEYLQSAMKKNSKAESVVEGYPISEQNYEKAVDSLRNRFGRNDLLVEYYTRELLSLVLQNAMSKGKNVSLSSIYDRLTSHIRALETLGVTTENYGTMLYPLVESSLPEEILRTWQRSAASSGTAAASPDSSNRLSRLLNFLQLEVENEERIEMAVTGFSAKSSTGKREEPKDSKPSITASPEIPSASALLSTEEKRKNKCIFCGGEHANNSCEKAEELSVDSRKRLARENHCCFRCIIRGHRYSECKVNIKCSRCGLRHSALMCSGLSSSSKSDGAPEKSVSQDNKSNQNIKEQNLATFCNFPDVYLKTLRVILYSNSKEITARVVIDDGSHRSYIRSEVAQFLGYEPLGSTEITHSLFGGIKANKSSHNVYQVRAKSITGDYACNFQAMDQPMLCDELSRVKKSDWYSELVENNISLSDVETKSRGHSEAPIDLLIGADIAGKLLTGNKLELSCGLTAIETKLGWTVMGRVPSNECKDSAIKAVSMFVAQAKVSDLWDLDVLGIRDPIEKSDRLSREKIVQDNFLQTVRLTDQSRYSVDLPWIEDHAPVSHNFESAMKRLEKTVCKLKNDNLYDEYDQVFREWVDEDVIEILPENESFSIGHFLPHRHVVKEGSTTKIRPVFDASAKEKGFPSLNACLEKGPNYIELIPSTLLRFRQHKIAVLADIRRAFLQIEINEKDRDFLRFLWFIKGVLRILRHKRVVFGLTCSPFLLGAVIDYHLKSIYHAVKEKQITRWSLEVVEKLRRAFYVDNVATSVKTFEELEIFMSQSKEILASASFDLRGWEYTHDDSSKETTSVLGILFDKKRDTLSVNPSIWKDISTESVTKRFILSVAHKVFDPIGFTSPVTLLPKLMLKKLWKDKTDWDTPVNESVRKEFLHWYEQLHLLNQIVIPRYFGSGDFSLHTFCDASELAYAAVTFLRVENETGVELIFLAAKARVTPQSTSRKKSSIPRLELLAASIGSRQAHEIVEALGFQNIPQFFWSDSTTVLAWIDRDIQWNLFVWNRVRQVRKLTGNGKWKYIPGYLNPADLPSRGCQALELLKSRWWKGPLFLYQNEKSWPNNAGKIDEDEVNSEKKKSQISLLNLKTSSKFEIVEKFSSYTKMIRFFAIMLRFKNFICKSQYPQEKILTYREIHDVELKFLKQLQNEMFSGDDDPRLSTLDTFRHPDGFIRVKTRIVERTDEFQFLFPIVLDPQSKAVSLLISETHENMCHAGVQSVMCNLRERFWILKMRKTVRAVISKCVICKRQNAKPIQMITAPLPAHRVEDSSVFEVVGVDFAGPVYLKDGEKSWICLYTCAVYRAVHLELAGSLSTRTFLGCFRRFISRRGRPSIVYSDNGTNFVGADNAFAKLDWALVAKHSSAKRIDWRFNPPTAAWWGGWWERLIGLLKRLLKKVLGKSCVTYEEMTTILCDCELALNSRPLTYLSDNPSDLKPLTPAMFMHDIPSSEVTDFDLLDSLDLNSSYKRKQELMEHFRKRFRREYLSQLVLKNKVRDTREIQIGDVVLIGDDNQKRMDWPLAKVANLITGRDGKSRVAILRCKDGTLKRPIQRIFPLEIRDATQTQTESLRRKASEKAEESQLASVTEESDERRNVLSRKTCQEEEIRAESDVKTRTGRKIVKPKKYL